VNEYILQGLQFGLIYSEEAFLCCFAEVQINTQVRLKTKFLITYQRALNGTVLWDNVQILY
jgi:hypothetical protein